MPRLVRDVGEKGLIANFVIPAFQQRGAEVEIGDDAAVVPMTPDLSLVLTIDRIPERLIAYREGIMSEREVGRYLASASLSDLAAMGATPHSMLLSIAMPPDYQVEQFEHLLAGVAEMAQKHSCPVVGGDTKEGTSSSFVVAAIGTIAPGRALRRRGARPGDVVVVTGAPGTFGVGLAYLLAARGIHLKLSDTDERRIFEKFLWPAPRTHAGQHLAALGLVTSCQDVSDGIGQTLHDVANASGVGMHIDIEHLLAAGPPQTYAVAEACGCAPEALLLGPGADFELVFTTPEEAVSRIAAVLATLGVPLHRLGRVVEGCEPLLVRGDAVLGQVPTGFTHFQSGADLDAIRAVYTKT